VDAVLTNSKLFAMNNLLGREANVSQTEDVWLQWQRRFTKLYSHPSTSSSRVLITAVRLQLALSLGFQLKAVHVNCCRVTKSLDPVGVLALAELKGVFNFERDASFMCLGAALYDRLELLQWLHARGSKWDIDQVLQAAAQHADCNREDAAMLPWLQQQTGPWSAATKARLLWCAGWCNNVTAMRYLRAEGAAWPESCCRTACSGM
jgi:hypothetical protein